MQGKLWLAITFIAGIVSAPFIAEGIFAAVSDAPAWFPYFVVVLISLAAGLAGDWTRGMALGLMIGIATVAALLAWGPEGFRDFLNLEVPPPL